MKYSNLIVSVCAILVASGCASSGPIPMGNDTYMISQTSAGGVFKAMGSLKADVLKQANTFAESKGKVAIPIAGKESPAYPGHMPNYEYQFRLVDKNDPRASGGALLPRADIVIERNDTIKADIKVQEHSDTKTDLYTELMKLDDLRKKGLITDTEFESQKQKLLNK